MTDLSRFFVADGPERVVVVGDVMLDSYQYGDIERISPEAPVPVLRHARRASVLGGAGNVAANLAHLGGAPVLIGRVGADAAGEEVAALCEVGGISAELACDGRVPTVRKTRFVSAGQQILRLDEERLDPLDGDTRTAVVTAFDAALADARAVILSDYGKGLLSGDLAAALIERAKNRMVPVVVDPKGRDFSRYAGADVVTPNRKELSIAVGQDLSGDDAIIGAAREQIGAHGLGALLVTRSEEGLSLVSAEAAFHVSAEAREVFDVSGAGDTVVATFALALARGLDRADAARLANSAAGIAVAKRGTSTVSAGELREALRQSGAIAGRLRTPLTQEDAKRAVEAWRREGLTVGFTNGCFDILHVGHASILERARALCDRLVVGLNSDASVTRLKGDGRPVNPAGDRAALLLALRSVDAVVMFEEDTPLALIEALLPDVLVKGADYTLENVVGADCVLAHGGRVELLDLEPGRSTSAIIERSKSPKG
ncbi:MAG: D-glycero-beta-D-manno-heptose-7-phosphate kinase [Pseudomonadota bacterium]